MPLEELVDLDLAKVTDVTNPFTTERGKIRVDGVSGLPAETSFEVADAGDRLIHESSKRGDRVAHGLSGTVYEEGNQ